MSQTWTEKYRPFKIADFWQADSPQISAVGAMLTSGRLPQLLILTGEFGCGKTSLARAIACRYLCSNSQTATGDPCGTCAGCMELSSRGSGTIVTDGYMEIDAATLTSDHILNVIRSHVMCNRLNRVPNPQFRSWVVCIDEIVHADAKLQPKLIKSTENLTRARFILCYSDPTHVLPALSNRGLELRLSPATEDQATAAVIRIAKAEGFDIADGAARMLVDSTRCIPRKCVSTLECAAGLTQDGVITIDAIQKALGRRSGPY